MAAESAVTAETLTRVQLAKGFETIILTLVITTLTVPAGAVEEYPDGYTASNFSVSGSSFYRTAHGARVGDNAQRVYSDRDEARAYVNGWFAHLLAKGWTRVS